MEAKAISRVLEMTCVQHLDDGVSIMAELTVEGEAISIMRFVKENFFIFTKNAHIIKKVLSEGKLSFFELKTS